MIQTHWKGAPPMPRRVTIESLPRAFEVIKEMQGQGYDWEEDYRCAGRDALADILEGPMVEAVDRHLERMSEGDEADRRWPLTELGRIELCLPRTRRFGAERRGAKAGAISPRT